MESLEKICTKVAALTSSVGNFIMEERKSFSQSAIEKKGHNDLVSYVDRRAEEMIVSGLKVILPEAGVIAEEGTSEKKSSGLNWIIDPLDGTTNFIHGMPCFCISIALMQEKELIAGIVHELNFDECFYGWKGGGSFMNGKKIIVSGVKELSSGLLATGFPYANYERMEPYMEVFNFCMRNTHGLRRLGSAAADLAYVACGRVDGFYEYGLNAWDVAAGALLVKEAGGKVTDFSGGDNFVFGGEIIATNNFISEEFLEVVKEKFDNN